MPRECCRAHSTGPHAPGRSCRTAETCRRLKGRPHAHTTKKKKPGPLITRSCPFHTGDEAYNGETRTPSTNLKNVTQQERERHTDAALVPKRCVGESDTWLSRQDSIRQVTSAAQARPRKNATQTYQSQKCPSERTTDPSGHQSSQ